MTSAIQVHDLRKTFGRTVALDGLDLDVQTGEIHGFLGPNGAGKSTTLRILLGLLRADSGSATLLGGDPWREVESLHRRLAYVPGDVALWPNLTGGEVIDILARLRGGVDEKRRASMLERFDLDPTKKGRSYSKGNRQKVALVAALSSDVELLLLDEPTSGLDPLMEAVFRDVVREFRRGRRHGAAVQPHPVRGGAGVRSRQHHPRGPQRRVGHPDRAPPPVADDGPRRRSRSPSTRRCSRRCPGVARRPRVRRPRDVHRRQRRPRAPARGARHARHHGPDERPPTLEELFMDQYRTTPTATS